MKTAPVLQYQISGHGPTVVLLHGYMATSRYWEKTTQQLARNHRVIALDLLGFGKSPKPGCSRYDLASQVASIDATLETIQGTKSFVLVGHSMGSLVALHYANDQPQRVKKLILTNMPIFATSREARHDVYRTRFFYRFALQPGLHGIIWPIFKAIMMLRLLPEQVTGNLKDHRHYMFQSNRFSRVRSMRNIIFQAGVEAELHALNVRTVIVSGLSDRAVYLRNLYEYKLDSSIRMITTPGGHHLPQSNPRLIAQLV